MPSPRPASRTVRRTAAPQRPASTALGVLALGVLMVGAGCATGWTDHTGPRSGQSEEGTGPDSGPVPPRPHGLPSPAQARSALTALAHVERRPWALPPYRRTEFGSAWADTDANGCNQRDDVLLRDAEPGSVLVQQQGRCDHDVLAGTWSDPYTGRTLALADLKDAHQSQAVQIDHVVPLAEAWRSGAWAWTSERRREFANSLEVLLAVDGPTNASKGDDDPAAWRPRAAYQCTYALRWTAVKSAWGLAADGVERSALNEMLASCPPE